jgi:hypothetical protein
MRTVGNWVIAHKIRDAAATQSGVDDERKWTNALQPLWYVLQTEQSFALCGIGEPHALQFFVVAIGGWRSHTARQAAQSRKNPTQKQRCRQAWAVSYR